MVTYILYFAEIILLAVFDILLIYRTAERKVKYSIISFLSMIFCGLFTFISGIDSIYQFLLAGMVAVLNLIVVYDLRTKYIPNVLLIALNILGLAASFFVPQGFFIKSILCAWLITGLCFLVGRKAKNGIGSGDLFCMSGLMMGMNFSDMMNFMFSSLLLGCIYGVGALIAKKKTMETEIPFAPFLLIGYLFMILFR